VGCSVPFVQFPMKPLELMRMAAGDNFFYIVYFQDVGVAESELEADVRYTMRKVLWGASGEGFTGPPAEPQKAEGGRFLGSGSEPPEELPAWLTEEDLDRYVASFERSGFFGPISYYRNLDANFETTKDFSADRVTMPSFFITGSKDVVLVMDPTGIERMTNALPNFKGAVLIEGAGHWVQQEAPKEFDAALLGFLATL
jgi:pimeloyl-ACP methyl ester carboxylesterase